MKKFKGGAAYLRKKFHEVNEEYPYVKFVFSDSQSDAEDRAYNILKNYYESHTNTEN
jgi:basic membrane lipoprotein Med (substrate-binding protein (PBP1-ABC) superfamily)